MKEHSRDPVKRGDLETAYRRAIVTRASGRPQRGRGPSRARCSRWCTRSAPGRGPARLRSLPLDIERVDGADRARAIELVGGRRGPARRCARPGEARDGGARVAIAQHGGLGILQRLEHGLLVPRQRFVGAGLGLPDLRERPTEIEDVPGQCRPDGVCQCRERADGTRFLRGRGLLCLPGSVESIRPIFLGLAAVGGLGPIAGRPASIFVRAGHRKNSLIKGTNKFPTCFVVIPQLRAEPSYRARHSGPVKDLRSRTDPVHNVPRKFP